jgi:hypothetical protein
MHKSPDFGAGGGLYLVDHNERGEVGCADSKWLKLFFVTLAITLDSRRIRDSRHVPPISAITSLPGTALSVWLSDCINDNPILLGGLAVNQLQSSVRKLGKSKNPAGGSQRGFALWVGCAAENGAIGLYPKLLPEPCGCRAGHKWYPLDFLVPTVSGSAESAYFLFDNWR